MNDYGVCKACGAPLELHVEETPPEPPVVGDHGDGDRLLRSNPPGDQVAGTAGFDRSAATARGRMRLFADVRSPSRDR